MELENRRLQQSIDSMNETTFHESANKILELEKDKKKLSIKVDQMQETYNRMQQQNKELEDVFQNALEENKKLQDTIDARQQSNERQSQEREVDRIKIIDLEKHIETLTKEKQRIHTLNESIQRRADDLERLGESRTKEMEVLKTKEKALDEMKNEVYELKTKLTSLEKENTNLSKDVIKLKETLEVSHMSSRTLTSRQHLYLDDWIRSLSFTLLEYALAHLINIISLLSFLFAGLPSHPLSVFFCLPNLSMFCFCIKIRFLQTIVVTPPL